MAPSQTPPSGSPDALDGRLLAGRYRLNRRIASGGMAEVWEATDQILSRRVAIKILHGHLAEDASFVQRFRGEAIAAARLAHPSIVSVYDTVTDGGLDGIVMELVNGTTLREDIDQHGPLQIPAALAIGIQVAEALGAAHAAGLVHRDIKPANILLATDGRVLVADFGIAKAVEGADLTNDGAMVGTAKYLAPEQVETGPVDGRTDLYALGIVLYESLTGTAPFVGDSDTATALARLHQDPDPIRLRRPDVAPALEAVITRALARRPADRFPDARSMRQALQACAAAPAFLAPPPAAPNVQPPASIGPPTDAPPPGHATDDDPAHRRQHRRRRRWPVVVLVVALLAAATGLIVSRRGTEAEPLTIATVTSFDPYGDNGSENDAALPRSYDGNSATAWTSERYRNPDLTTGKGGVGLVVHLDRTAELETLTLTTPSSGWNAAVYVTDGEPPASLTGWGDPVGTIENGRDATDITLFGRTARAVLIWFTHMAPDGRIAVSEIGITGT